MPGWWVAIPMAARVTAALVGAVLLGVALAGWIQLPSQASANTAAIQRLDVRVVGLEYRLEQFVNRMDTWACIQVAEAEGRPIQSCR